MALNANRPTDQAPVSELPSYIREDRAEINAVTTGSGFTVTDLVVDGGATSLTIGHELSAVGHEIIFATCLTAAELATILGGTHGQLKTIIFGDNNIDMRDGLKADGKFYLNQLPALGLFNPMPDVDDILCLVNVGGDGAGAHGYWRELYRTISVKPI